MSNIYGGLEVSKLSRTQYNHLFASFKRGQGLHALRFHLSAAAPSSPPRPWAIFLGLQQHRYILRDTDSATLLKWTRDVLLLDPSRRGRLSALQLGIEMFHEQLKQPISAEGAGGHRDAVRIGDATLQQLLALCECTGDLAAASGIVKSLVARQESMARSASPSSPPNAALAAITATSYSWLLRVAYACQDDVAAETSAASVLDLVAPTLNMQSGNIGEAGRKEGRLTVASHDDTLPSATSSAALFSVSSSTIALSTATMLHLLRPRFRTNAALQRVVDESIRPALLEQDGSPFACNFLHLRFLERALMQEVNHGSSVRNRMLIENKKNNNNNVATTNGALARDVTASLLDRVREERRRLISAKQFSSSEHAIRFYSGSNWDNGAAPMCLASMRASPSSSFSSSFDSSLSSSSSSDVAAQSALLQLHQQPSAPHLRWTVQRPFPLVNTVLSDSIVRALEEASSPETLSLSSVFETIAAVPEVLARDTKMCELFAGAGGNSAADSFELKSSFRMRDRDFFLLRSAEYLTASSATPELMHYAVSALCNSPGSVGIAVQTLAKMLAPVEEERQAEEEVEEEEEEEQRQQRNRGESDEAEDDAVSLVAQQPLDVTLAVAASATLREGTGAVSLAAAICAHASLVRSRRLDVQRMSLQERDKVSSTASAGSSSSSSAVPAILSSYWHMDYPTFFFESNALPEFHFFAMIGVAVGVKKMAHVFHEQAKLLDRIHRDHDVSAGYQQEIVTTRSPIVLATTNSSSKAAASSSVAAAASLSTVVADDFDSIDFNAHALHSPPFRTAVQIVLMHTCLRQHNPDDDSTTAEKEEQEAVATTTAGSFSSSFSSLTSIDSRKINDAVNDALSFIPRFVPVFDNACIAAGIAGWSRYVPGRPLWNSLAHVAASIREWQPQSALIIVDASFLEASEQALSSLLTRNNNNNLSSNSRGSGAPAKILVPFAVLQTFDAIAVESDESAPIDSESLRVESEVRRVAVHRLQQLAAAAVAGQIEIVHFSEQLLAATTRPYRRLQQQQHQQLPLHSLIHDSDSIIIDVARMLSLAVAGGNAKNAAVISAPPKVLVATNDVNLVERVESEFAVIGDTSSMIVGTLSSAPRDLLVNPEAADRVFAQSTSSRVVSFLQQTVDAMEENQLHRQQSSLRRNFARPQEGESGGEDASADGDRIMSKNNNNSPLVFEEKEQLGEWQQLLEYDDAATATATVNNDDDNESQQSGLLDENDGGSTSFFSESHQRHRAHAQSEQRPMAAGAGFSTEFRGRLRDDELPYTGASPAEETGERPLGNLEQRAAIEEGAQKRLTPFRPGHALRDESHLARPPITRDRVRMAGELSARAGMSIPRNFEYKKYRANIADPRNAELVERYFAEKAARDANGVVVAVGEKSSRLGEEGEAMRFAARARNASFPSDEDTEQQQQQQQRQQFGRGQRSPHQRQRPQRRGISLTSGIDGQQRYWRAKKRAKSQNSQK